jgi:hypothetical protein
MKMIAVIKVSAVVLFLLIGSICCSGKNPVDADTSVLSPNTFPMSIGVLWTYEVYDSLTESTDTILVSIVDTVSTCSGSFVTVWKCKLSDVISTRYVGVAGDTLAIQGDSLYLLPSEYFVFPLTVGSKWNGPCGIGDTSGVTRSGGISVPAGDFNSGVRIDRLWDVDFEGGGNSSSTWIVPEVGIVFRYLFSQFSDGSTIYIRTNEVWKLLRYDLSTFGIEQFPITIGSEWVYETHYSHWDVCDTIHVKIAGTTNVPDGRDALIWEYRCENLVDTQYVIVAENRLEVYPNRFFICTNELYYEFPLAVGRNWGVETFDPLPDVIGRGRITVPAGTFESGFHHVYGGGGYNYYWLADDWLVPGVGFVSHSRGVIDLGPPVTTTWKLLSYQIVGICGGS